MEYSDDNINDSDQLCIFAIMGWKQFCPDQMKVAEDSRIQC